jgi:hypothetical protein
MTISRAQMGSQLKGGIMKKKTVKKKAVGGVLGLLTGKTDMVPLGIIPQMLYQKNKKNKAVADTGNAEGIAAAQRNREIMQKAASRMQPRKMKSGGKCRGMGAAKRGGDFMIG